MSLFQGSREFDRASSHVTSEQAHAQVAALAALIDPAFVDSASWPCVSSESHNYGPPDDRWHGVVMRYSANGPQAIEVDDRDTWKATMVSAEAVGLRDGMRLTIIHETYDEKSTTRVCVSMPTDLAERVFAAYAAL